MTTRANTPIRTVALLGAALLLAACAGQQDPGNASVERRGSGAGAPQVSGDGIVAYDGYAAARAREGDTVQTLAARIGLSATELGAYNGLSPTHPLRAGDELVLPPRPGGYTPSASQPVSRAPLPETAAAPAIEAQPLELSEPAPAPLVEADPAPTALPDASVATASAPAASPEPTESGWSPDLVLGAIDRSEGTPTPGSDVAIGAPPSAGDPLPPEPRPARPLASPGLSQYQSSGASSADPVPAPAPVPSGTTTLAAAPAAAPSPAPVQATGGRLQRPVEGPVALGFRQGAGGARNDGVDFAAPAGAQVVAAEAGEVALVSEALGGLGTIVLLRHQGELLTVYGRISGVTVQRGDRVARGQPIGVVAQPETGEPRMHFEVREGPNSVDPMTFL